MKFLNWSCLLLNAASLGINLGAFIKLGNNTSLLIMAMNAYFIYDCMTRLNPKEDTNE